MLTWRKLVLYLILAANFALIGWFWSRISGPLMASGYLEDAFIALGRLAGLFAAFFVLLQFVTIGRNAWLERTFGLDRLAIFHHWTGYFALFFVVAHPALLTLGYSRANGWGLIEQTFDFARNFEDVLQAMIAVTLLEVIVFLSVYIVRKRLKYETWYCVHLLTYLAILLAWGHQLQVGTDLRNDPVFIVYWYSIYAIAALSFAFFRFARPLWRTYRHQFKVARIVPETDAVNSIYITGRDLTKFPARAGQFVMIRFLAPGFALQSHPFSLSKAPGAPDLRLTIKALGDFTRELPKLPLGTPVVVDGPYGIFTAEATKNDKLLFIAGGIGITPIRAILEDLSPKKDAVLIYANRTKKDAALSTELEEIMARRNQPFHTVLSDDPEAPGEHGFVDGKLLARMVPDLDLRDIFICGPVPMLQGLLKDLRAAGVRPERIHYERFSLH